MKSDEFQAVVLKHLGEQKIQHDNISCKLLSIEKKQDITNGRVNGLEKRESALKAQIGIMVAIFTFGMNIAWQYLKDIFKG